MALDALALPDLPADEPAGPSMEFDADFGALERASQGKPEVQYGNTIEAAVPPEWKEVEALALSLLARTRDLRIMVHLAIARLHLAGLPPFVEVLTGIRTLLETQWQAVHPRLDPDDDLDPMVRSNTLAKLRDPGLVLRTLRDMPLAGNPRTGQVTYRDIAIFNGTLELEKGKEKKTEAVISGTFRDTEPARRTAMIEAAQRGIDEAAAIPAAFDRQAGVGSGPDLSELGKLLREIHRELVRFSPVEAPAADDGAPEGDAASGTAPDGAAVGGPSAAPRGFASIKSITAVHKREDVLHLLDLVLGYYRQYEPSSPLPLLLERARRLAPLDFMEILRNLAPDGINQAKVVAGPDADGSASSNG